MRGLLVLAELTFCMGWPTSGQAGPAEAPPFGPLAISPDDQLVGKSLLEPQETFDVYDYGRGLVSQGPSSLGPSLPRVGPTPEFVGLGPWYNSAPLRLASLRGRVVLVAFWTHSSSNCIRTLPYLEEYWTRYQNEPFVLVGIHTPEYMFEESPQNVAAAVEHYGLTFPIAQDDEYATWNAFGNRYWPALYLIDKSGTVLAWRNATHRGGPSSLNTSGRRLDFLITERRDHHNRGFLWAAPVATRGRR